MDMSKMVAVKGHDGYFFDEHLNVWSFKRKTPRKLNAARRWVNGGSRNKHLRVNLNGKRCDIHRIVYETFNGPIPEGMLVRHFDDNELNNDPSNLVVGTVKDNWDDAIRNGTVKSLLKKWQVEEIVKLLVHFKASEVAEFYNVSKGCIVNIENGRNWKHVSRENRGFGDVQS
jgi:hypothetical protein